MGVAYRAVQWNRHKRVYDLILLIGVALFLLTFIGIGGLVGAREHSISGPILLMRALGTCAIVLLHLILWIGPLCRIDRRFMPLLYNRRHLGVTMFTLALLHAALATVWYHGFGVLNALTSILVGNDRYDSFIHFPFESLGLAALVILFLMAATSHDFWLANLSPRIWKALHMGVYVAYGLLIMHVALGVMQSERSVLIPVLLGIGLASVVGSHVAAGLASLRTDRAQDAGEKQRDGWIPIGNGDDIPEGGAKIVRTPGGADAAVFRHGDKLSAVSNVCAHQGGPLGEGRVIDGCITCPWHGYQYRPEDGCSPPPYSEKIPTFELRLEDGQIWLKCEALDQGTPVKPLTLDAGGREDRA